MDAGVLTMGVPEPVALGVGEPQVLGPNPYLAAVLGVLVAIAVFFLMLKIRKTFGMKE